MTEPAIALGNLDLACRRRSVRVHRTEPHGYLPEERGVYGRSSDARAPADFATLIRWARQA